MLLAKLHPMNPALGRQGCVPAEVGWPGVRATAGDREVTGARLHPDFGGSPLWLPNRRVEWEEIRVSPPLRFRLEAWVNEALHDPGSVIEDREFDAEGRELARLLSEELHWSVVYET